MASIRLQDIALNPNGEYAKGDMYRFTHMSTTGQTTRGSISNELVEQDGSYDFNLEYGRIFVESRSAQAGGAWVKHGIVVVNSDTTASTIPELLNAVVPPTDDQLLEFQTLLADATDEADRAETARDAAHDWATAAEDTSVNDGVNPVGFSANHYAEKASASADQSAAYSLLITESEARAIQKQNENSFAASGLSGEGGIYVE